MIRKQTIKRIIGAISAVAVTLVVAVVIGLAQTIDYGELSGILPEELLQQHAVQNTTPFVMSDAAITATDQSETVNIALNQLIYAKKTKGVNPDDPDIIQPYNISVETPQITTAMLEKAGVKVVSSDESTSYFSGISIADVDGQAHLVINVSKPVAATASYPLELSLIDANNITTNMQTINFDFIHTQAVPEQPLLPEETPLASSQADASSTVEVEIKLPAAEVLAQEQPLAQQQVGLYSIMPTALTSTYTLVPANIVEQTITDKKPALPTVSVPEALVDTINLPLTALVDSLTTVSATIFDNQSSTNGLSLITSLPTEFEAKFGTSTDKVQVIVTYKGAGKAATTAFNNLKVNIVQGSVIKSIADISGTYPLVASTSVTATKSGGSAAEFDLSYITPIPTTIMQGQKFRIKFAANNFTLKSDENLSNITDAKYRSWLKNNLGANAANFAMKIIDTNDINATAVTVEVTALVSADYKGLAFYMNSGTDETDASTTKTKIAEMFPILRVTQFGSTTLKTYAAAKITGINANASLGVSPYSWTMQGTKILTANTDLDYVKTNEVLRVPITSSMFVMSGLPEDGVLYGVTTSQLSTAKITAVSTIAKGSKLFNKVSLDTINGTAAIKIAFVQPYVSTKIEDFDISVALSMAVTSSTDTVKTNYLQFTGTVGNPIVDVYNDDESVDLSDGSVAFAVEAVKTIEVQLNDEVTLKSKLNKNRYYYGTADNETTSSDDTTMDEYPDIEMVYNLRTIGLSSTSDKVTFDLDTKYHVYDYNLIYLGTSDKSVVYSTKYYMATKKLGVPGDSGEDSSETSSNTDNSQDLPTETPPTGITDNANTNNFNPATGR